MRLVHEVAALDIPNRRTALIVVVTQIVAVLQNAPHLHAGQGEDLALNVPLARLLAEQVFWFCRERDDGPIGMNRAAFDVGDLPGTPQIGETDRGQLLAFLGKHLDPRVVALIMHRIVGDLLDIEIHRIGPGSLGVGGHLQFFGVWRLELRVNHGR